jgi:Ca2+-binding RTX toxin-like protein
MLGQDGSDLLIWNNGDGSDFMEGGEGFDFVQVNGSNTAGDSFRIDPNGSRVRFRRTNLALFTLDIGTVENLDVNGQGGSDVIIGAVGLVGLVGLDLDGGEGNDLLIGGDGADVLRGGAGNDVLLGGRGNDVVLGQDGDDLMIWNDGDGSDFIEGGEGADAVQVNGSNSGDVILVSPNGSRVHVERTNLDTFTLDVGTTETIDINTLGGNDQVTASLELAAVTSLDIDGGTGNDEVKLTTGSGDDEIEIRANGSGLQVERLAPVPILVSLRGTEELEVDTGSGADSVTVQDLTGVASLQTLIFDLGDGNDMLDASLLAASVGLIARGGEGNDILVGGSGNDVLIGDGGRDIIIGNDGNDVILGGDGDDIVNAGNGNDVVLGGAGDDQIAGGRGDDTLLGGDDDDLLIGGLGFDYLDGGSGTDRAVTGETVVNIP